MDFYPDRQGEAVGVFQIMLNSERPQLRRLVVHCLLASFVLTACGLMPAKQVAMPPDAPLGAATRDAADVQRIDELERQLSEQQRQLTERQRQLDEWQRRLTERKRQLTERRHEFLEEKQRLELELKESQNRSDELQKKLDAILAIDRDLRRGSKSTE